MCLSVCVRCIIGKWTQSPLLLSSFQVQPLRSVTLEVTPPPAPQSSANIVNILDAMAVSLSLQASEDVCSGLLSVSTHVQSGRLLQRNGGQTLEFIFPSQIYPLAPTWECPVLLCHSRRTKV